MSEDTMPIGAVPQTPYNAADENQISVATIQDQRRDQRERRDLAAVLATEEGRRVITRILQLTGLQSLSPAEPAMTQRYEGARSVGLEILNILRTHSIHIYPQLLVEAALTEERDLREREAALAEREKAMERGIDPWLDGRPRRE